MQKTALEAFLAEEVKKYKGIYVPLKSGFLRRTLVTRLPVKKLHPNPDDEFCMPQIGPNYGIISQYEAHIRRTQVRGEGHIFEEPLVVERIRPDGYMLLNGHHRWAAARNCHLKRVPVEIVNLTQAMDIKRMLWHSRHDRRAALDLDEVVLCGADEPAEKPLPFPFNRFYRHRLRLGIPALFHFLNVHGYDVWVYSAGYHTPERIKALLRLYHADVTGIVTGNARKRLRDAKVRAQIDSLMAEKYTETLSIDRGTLVRVDRGNRAFEECDIDGAAENWSSAVMERIGQFEKQS